MNNIRETRKEYSRRNQKLRKLGYKNYSDYLKSGHWQEMKVRVKKKRCICKNDDRLELHHKTYSRIGEEHLSDLVWLCHNCHEYLHDIVSKGEVSLKNSFVKLKKDLGVWVSRKRYKHKKKADEKSRKNNKSRKNHSKKIKKMREHNDQITKQRQAEVSYRSAYKQWLSNKDYSLPKPNINDYK
jgi:hypothetical protein